MKQKYELKEEWAQQTGVIFAGLIGIGVVIVQALIGINATDPPAVIAMLAFAIALPLLSTLVMINVVQSKYKYASYPFYLTFAYVVGQSSAIVGIIAAFWHVSWIAGVLIMISSLVGLAIYFAYSRQLERDNLPAQHENGQ
ncbi:MAG TPA: hypothetical protein VFL17_10285 [Anaerolineae bacterium]|nr:hypothetical protein [Anaerolineae bacterium]